MKSMLGKWGLLALILITSVFTQSQAASSSGNFLFYGLMALAVVLFFFFVVSIADNLMVIESRESSAADSGHNFGLFPRISEIIAPSLPAFLKGKHVISLKKGHDIGLEGEAAKTVAEGQVSRFAISPMNFLGLQPIPKVTVEVGDSVKAGDTVFFDKKAERIKFAAPVSGEIIEVSRGAKRAIANIVILADKEQESRTYEVPAENASRQEIVDFLLDSGAWPFIQQRPYNVIADPTIIPRDIFISTFDTAPLAPDLGFTVKGREAAFQKGLDVLNKLSGGLVYLGLDGRGDTAPPAVFTEAKGVQKRYFRGAHPAGNVGVQIHHIHPIGGADKVWTLDVNGVLTIGELFLSGQFTTSRLVALAGAPLQSPQYVQTHAGANMGELLKNRLQTTDNLRMLSGDVLSGAEKTNNDFLNFHENQVTVLVEGNEAELFGWLLPLKARASISPTIPAFTDKIEADTNTHGEKRAFVVTSDYEQVMPMDIYTQQLMKAILVNDFEKMEGLGIYELVEEDVALAEFACVSKQPLQQILRQGLETMREQG